MERDIVEQMKIHADAIEELQNKNKEQMSIVSFLVIFLLEQSITV